IGQAQWMVAEVLQTGRGGVLADYTRSPLAPGRTRTVAEVERAGVRPLVCGYSAEQILTWETSAGRLTRAVLCEQFADYSNGEVEYLPQLRELLMVGGTYA